MHVRTETIDSPFNPTILNNIIGNDKDIKRKILMSQFFIKMCKRPKVIEHHITIKIAVW